MFKLNLKLTKIAAALNNFIQNLITLIFRTSLLRSSSFLIFNRAVRNKKIFKFNIFLSGDEIQNGNLKNRNEKNSAKYF